MTVRMLEAAASSRQLREQSKGTSHSVRLEANAIHLLTLREGTFAVLTQLR